MDMYETYPQLADPTFIEAYDFEGCWTKTKPDSPMAEIDVAAALIQTNANYSQAARLLGRSRRSLEGFVTRHEGGMLNLYLDIREALLDHIESLHMEAAINGDVGVQRFFLTTKAADRGYNKPTNIGLSGPNGGPIQVEDKTKRDADEFTRRIVHIASAASTAGGDGVSDPGDES